MTRTANRTGENAPTAGLWAQAAHDLRQPVQAALLLAGTLGEAAEPARVRAAAAHIGSALQSLCRMLDTLALLARIEAGLETVLPGACRLADDLEPAIGGLAPTAEKRGVPLRVGPVAGVVRSHPALLVAAGKSLVMNAIRYGDRRGIDVGCRRSGDHIRLEVRFSGVLPDTGRNRNAFVQLPSPAGDELGLGLPLLQHLCARLGHDLHHTELGGRHLLALTLPLLASSGEAAPVSR